VSERIRLLVVDDHALFREGLTRLLENDADLIVVAKCGSAREALRAMAAVQPDVVLLDFDLGPERASEFIPHFIQGGHSARVLIVTAGVSGDDAVQLIRSGVAPCSARWNRPARRPAD
jgi:DNA-binding NarL/FixJ family response regulator